MSFPLNWITQQICTGYAPKSYDDLDSIRDQGIDAIINLCGEYSDLHTIEEQAGFEVYWLPIDDERAPDIEEMEKGLSWLDEAAYLGKKVLIHCNLGIGRTGTFLTAYFLRRGFTLRKTEKMLKAIPPSPTNFTQWRLLRKFGKKEGKFKLMEPRLENRNRLDLSHYLTQYQNIIEQAENLYHKDNEPNCPFDSNELPSPLQVIEAISLNEELNVSLPTTKREEIIQKALETETLSQCPLREKNQCLLHSVRPLHCRIKNDPGNKEKIEALYEELEKISQDLFIQLFGDLKEKKAPDVSLRSVVSGKFIQHYFDFLLTMK